MCAGAIARRPSGRPDRDPSTPTGYALGQLLAVAAVLLLALPLLPLIGLIVVWIRLRDRGPRPDGGRALITAPRRAGDAP